MVNTKQQEEGSGESCSSSHVLSAMRGGEEVVSIQLSEEDRSVLHRLLQVVESGDTSRNALELTEKVSVFLLPLPSQSA